MRERIATIGPIAAVAGAFGLCCGLPVLLSMGSWPRDRRMVTAELGPHRVVSEFYVFSREAIAPDVAFLRGVEGHRAITEFDRTIYLLRTAKQHEDNVEAREF